jgi:NAD(P)-dependent dehydrogenase (short-subunit alcohol dehydrogenase family)
MSNLNFSGLNGKICVITGGAGVIGTAICKGLVTAGIKVAILDLKKDSADLTADCLNSEFPNSAVGFEANVLDKNSLIKAKKLINKEMGAIDFLINCAGGNAPNATTQLEQITPDDLGSLEKSFFGLEIEGFEKVFALNFTGTLLPTMVLAEDMLHKGSGSIINISSMNSFKPLTKIPAYSAAKASINNFTQWLAVHLAKTGVRVNAVAPGFFLTNQNRFLLTDEKTGEPTARGIKIISNTPMGKYGEPEELQGAVLFLLSELSSFITGIIIPVDGGYSAFGGV